MDKINGQKVILNDSYWSPRLETNAKRAIFHQWNQLEASGCIDNFRIAAGEKEGFREGWFFADSDAHKWLDAAARIYAQSPSPDLAELMDGYIALLGRAQDPDGYLFTYNQILFPGIRWANLQIEHELYCHGHLIEAGASHQAATGKTEMLEIARRAADLLVKDFLGAGPERTPGHEEIEIALLRLYHLTEHGPYLELARHFLEQRGRTKSFALSIFRQNTSVAKRGKEVQQQRQAFLSTHPGYVPHALPAENFAKRPPTATLRWQASALSGKYFQQHAPIREQLIPVGHSVRFGYLETAVAMLHRLQPDDSLLPALEKAWEHMVTRRMYITGGIGSLPALEGFGRDYELDPETAYAETCAALASMFWSWEMALISGQAQYSDLFEWQLYNAAAVGMGLTGENYLYNNPLACRGGIERKAWYAVPCCPSNLSRTWADLGKYIFSANNKAIWIHQYIGSQASFNLGGQVKIAVESKLPWDGKVHINVDPIAEMEFTLNLRLPSWSMKPPTITVWNGQEPHPTSVENRTIPGEATAQGYDPRLSRFLPIQRVWTKGDWVEINFELPVIIRHAHPKVKGHQHKVALTRGPLVYCLESLDNPGLDIFSARLDPSSLQAEWDENLFRGITVLRGCATDGTSLTFIPYQLWANRGPSQMTVWVNV
jgi:uncharacterized protein